MTAKPVVSRELANWDIDDAIAYYLSEGAEPAALGVAPEMKYQNESGPDLAQCFDLVRRATRPNAPQILRLLDDVISMR